MPSGQQNNYHAYLLRLWRDDEFSAWRASLQDARAGELISFSSVTQLVAFLEAQTSPDEQKPGHKPGKQ
jgi:hypothetical protein